MPNTFDPEELICARCGETRRPKFGESRADTEIELTPVDGLLPVYFCKSCKRLAEYSADAGEIQRQYAVYNSVNGIRKLTGPATPHLTTHRVNEIQKRTTT